MDEAENAAFPVHSHHYAHVAYAAPAAAGAEEDQVALTQVGRHFDVRSLAVLLSRVAGYVYAYLAVDIACEAGAVELVGTVGSPAVGLAQVFPRERDGQFSEICAGTEAGEGADAVYLCYQGATEFQNLQFQPLIELLLALGPVCGHGVGHVAQRHAYAYARRLFLWLLFPGLGGDGEAERGKAEQQRQEAAYAGIYMHIRNISSPRG